MNKVMITTRYDLVDMRGLDVLDDKYKTNGISSC